MRENLGRFLCFGNCNCLSMVTEATEQKKIKKINKYSGMQKVRQKSGA